MQNDRNCNAKRPLLHTKTTAFANTALCNVENGRKSERFIVCGWSVDCVLFRPRVA